MCGVAQPYNTIPNGLETIIRRVFAEYGNRLVESPTSENWKKYLLLPTILYDPRRGLNNKERKNSIKLAAEQLFLQDWFKLTIGQYLRRNRCSRRK